MALIALGILLIGAFILFKQRILFADAAFIAFNIINYKNMAIQIDRYGSFISQLFPYVGMKLHLPVKSLLVLYSASFNIFYFAVAFILYRCRQYGLTILTALYYFLIISASWFWTNNEVHQAVGWMFLMYGITTYMGSRKVNIIFTTTVFAILAFLTIFTHFVVIIPTVFLWVYFIIEKDNWPFSKAKTIVLSLILVAIVAYKYIRSVAPSGSYETGHLYNLTHFSLQDIIDSFSTPVVRMFLYRCLTNYWIGAIIFIVSVVVLIRQKKKALAIWTVLSLTGYLIIMGLTYGTFDEFVLLFHIESEWASIGIIMATAMVFSFLPTLNYKTAAILLACVFVIRIGYIATAFPGFNQRIKTNESIVARMREKGLTKVAIYNNDSLVAINKLTWGIPYETLMNSALEGDKPQLVFFFVNKDDKRAIELATTTTKFYSGNSYYNTDDLNSDYFSVDTTVNFKVMSYEELMQ